MLSNTNVHSPLRRDWWSWSWKLFSTKMAKPEQLIKHVVRWLKWRSCSELSFEKIPLLIFVRVYKFNFRWSLNHMTIFPSPQNVTTRCSRYCSTCVPPWRLYMHYTTAFCWVSTIRHNSASGFELSQITPLKPKFEKQASYLRVTRSLTARAGCNIVSPLLYKCNSNLRKYLPCIRYHRHYTTSGDSFLCFAMHYKHHGET